MKTILVTILAVLILWFAVFNNDNHAGANFKHQKSTLNLYDDGVIAFLSDRDGNPEIYVMNADGSTQTRLTNHPLHDMNPSISPDGKKVAFLTSRHDPNAVTNFPRCNFEIHIINTDGSNEFQLTNIASYAGFIDWSSDGTKLVFQADCDNDSKKEIYIINSDGTNLTRLTNNSCNDVWPDWSPDNSKIVFCSDRDGNYEIYTMNIDGSNQQRITSNSTMEGGPHWSPDGSQIVFMSDRVGYQAIFVMNADGTNVQQLTNQTDQFGECPAWSPDGEQIAYHAPKDNNYEICVMDSDGSNHRILTNHNGNDMWPSWGLGSLTTVNDYSDFQGSLPDQFQLYQNYPNPFNPTTKIRFEIPKQCRVQLKIYNSLGREIVKLADRILTAGIYEYEFNASRVKSNLANGLYLYELKADDLSQVNKMLLLK